MTDFNASNGAPWLSDSSPFNRLAPKQRLDERLGMDIREQYRHPLWQKRRLEIMEKAEFECSFCGAREKTLNVHHKHYIKGRNVWDYSDDELECLCEECHAKIHGVRQALNALIADSGMLDMVYGYALGIQWRIDHDAGKNTPVYLANWEQSAGFSDGLSVDWNTIQDNIVDGVFTPPKTFRY